MSELLDRLKAAGAQITTSVADAAGQTVKSLGDVALGVPAGRIEPLGAEAREGVLAKTASSGGEGPSGADALSPPVGSEAPRQLGPSTTNPPIIVNRTALIVAGAVGLTALAFFLARKRG